MKKVYLQPNTRICNSEITMIIATSPTDGSANALYGGGATGTSDANSSNGEGVGATGSDATDDDFSVGSKRRFYTGF